MTRYFISETMGIYVCSYIAGGNAKSFNTCGEEFGYIEKSSIWINYLTLKIYLKDTLTKIQNEIYTGYFFSIYSNNKSLGWSWGLGFCLCFLIMFGSVLFNDVDTDINKLKNQWRKYKYIRTFKKLRVLTNKHTNKTYTF